MATVKSTTRPARGPGRRDGRTREARAQRRDTRSELLEAALAVFAERGYRDASVEEVAARAGYSKGALYWHFKSKDEMFLAVLDEYVDRPWREGIALLERAGPDLDMSADASRRFGEMLRGQAELLTVEHEYRAHAFRDANVRKRYAKRQREVRSALGRALAARVERLGGPPLPNDGRDMASLFMALTTGLAQERVVDPDAVPERLLGDAFALLYAGHAAGAG